jgi:hypothetical protein
MNVFLKSIKAPVTNALPSQFSQVLFQSHFVLVIGAAQAIGGLLLLINRVVLVCVAPRTFTAKASIAPLI